MYTCRESNPNLKNRNLPFYPLNYRCIFRSNAKVQTSEQNTKLALVFYGSAVYSLIIALKFFEVSKVFKGFKGFKGFEVSKDSKLPKAPTPALFLLHSL